MSVTDVRSQEVVNACDSEGAIYRRAILQALCLGAAVDIVNLLDAEGADHTYTARDFAAVIYRNIHGTPQ